MKVDKHTRAGKNGKVIVCPCGDNSRRVYHFAWGALTCPCGKMIEKEDWRVRDQVMKFVDSIDIKIIEHD